MLEFSFFFLAELEEDYLFLQELERPKSRVHDNLHDDMIMYVIMHDQHPVHRLINIS